MADLKKDPPVVRQLVKKGETIRQAVERYNKLSKAEQKVIDDRLAKANNAYWDRIKGKIAKQTQVNKANAYKQVFESLSKAQKIEKIKRGMEAKEYQKLITKGTQGLSSASIKWLTRLIGGPIVGTLSYLFDPSPAGEPDELKKLREIEAAGFKPTEAGRKRGVPGASKKNYSKGGGVRTASY